MQDMLLGEHCRRSGGGWTELPRSFLRALRLSGGGPRRCGEILQGIYLEYYKMVFNLEQGDLLNFLFQDLLMNLSFSCKAYYKTDMLIRNAYQNLWP